MRPVRSWEFSTPMALTACAVSRKRRKIRAASAAGKLRQNVFRHGKDGPIVDFQDARPRREHLAFWIGYVIAADQVPSGLTRLHTCRQCARERPGRWQ